MSDILVGRHDRCRVSDGGLPLIGWALVLCWTLATGLAPARGQPSFVTIQGDLNAAAWWVLADFHPFTTEVRGVPAGKIRKSWCKATEFRKELIPEELRLVDGVDGMATSKLSFSLEGRFDGTSTKQIAIVGVYQECSGSRGRFVLILDQPRNGAPKIRFVDAVPTDHQFGALSPGEDNSIIVWACMECDNTVVLKWDPEKHRFAWLPHSAEP
jgi:hypothetical protein